MLVWKRDWPPVWAGPSLGLGPRTTLVLQPISHCICPGALIWEGSMSLLWILSQQLWDPSWFYFTFGGIMSYEQRCQRVEKEENQHFVISPFKSVSKILSADPIQQLKYWSDPTLEQWTFPEYELGAIQWIVWIVSIPWSMNSKNSNLRSMQRTWHRWRKHVH